MKILIIIPAIFALTYANPIDSDAAQFECTVNYLRDKKMLDKKFKYYAQVDKIACDSFIAETREKFMNELFTDESGSSIEEEDEEIKQLENLMRQNKDCITEQLLILEYPELKMKEYVFSKAKRLSKKQKKRLLARVEHQETKRMTIATGICFPEFTFGEMFDDFMEDDDEEETLDDKQHNYCIRKYIIDNELIDTKKFTINLNPDNITLDFPCSSIFKYVVKLSEDLLKENFETGPAQSRRQRECLNETVSNQNALGYISNVSIFFAGLTTEQKAEFRDEFIAKMKAFYIEMAKCSLVI